MTSNPAERYAPPPLLLAATIRAPFAASSSIVPIPTFPTPCTATLALCRSSPTRPAASSITCVSPTDVALPRPSDPPIATGLPVTTAGTE